jgi:hypothetical protein
MDYFCIRVLARDRLLRCLQHHRSRSRERLPDLLGGKLSTFLGSGDTKSLGDGQGADLLRGTLSPNFPAGRLVFVYLEGNIEKNKW